MNNYLFFRTDRIGDFLVSAILLQSIKRNNDKSCISIIASKKNYFYIKKMNFIDEVYLYPDSLIKKIFFFLKLNKKKYDLIVALDGKKRSIYFSLFLRSKKKFLMTTKSLFQKMFNKFFTKIFLFKKSKNKLIEIKELLKIIGMNFQQEDIFFLKNQKISQKKISLIPNFSIFHFDEKWIYQDYIKKYKPIQPENKEFEIFIENLIKRLDQNLVISTGVKINEILLTFLKKFNKINDNLYEKNISGKIVQVYINIDFLELNYLIKNCNQIITCHGASTHVASAYGKKILDIFDKSQDEFYSKWNSHINNYYYFYRENFSNLSQKIINKL